MTIRMCWDILIAVSEKPYKENHAMRTGKKLLIKLNKVPENFIPSGGYKAVVTSDPPLDYDEVLEEIVSDSGLRLQPFQLKSILSATFESIISRTYRDGRVRRIGDYLSIRPKVKGRFSSRSDAFDPERHELVLEVRALKAFRAKPKTGNVVQVFNRNAGPQVVLESLRSASTPECEDLLFGDDLVVRGMNLTQRPGDEMNIVLYTTGTVHGNTSVSIETEGVTATEDEIRIPWAVSVGKILPGDMKKYVPVFVQVEVRSRGGDAEANMQRHRVRAFLASWHSAHPDDDLSRYQPRWF